MMQWDDNLFEGMILPEGMDNSTLVDLIVMYAGDLYPYYQVPDQIRKLSANWYHRKLHNFTLMYNALMKEYDPLYNYDRIEQSTETPDITRVETPDITHQSNGGSEFTGSTQDNGNVSENNNASQSSTVNNNTKRGVSAFDVADYSPRDETITEESNGAKTSNELTRTIKNSGTSNVTNKDSNTTTETGTRTHTETGTIKKELRAYGNIGVTTSQQMLQSELELRLFDLYDVIANMWIKDFIVTLY